MKPPKISLNPDGIERHFFFVSLYAAVWLNR